MNRPHRASPLMLFRMPWLLWCCCAVVAALPPLAQAQPALPAFVPTSGVIPSALITNASPSAEELGAKERDLTDQLFRMRIQKSMGQLEAPDKMRTVRRDLARIKTVLRQKRAG